MTDSLSDIVRRHRAGEVVGIVSVCSAHPLVLEATMLEAAASGTESVLVEATSNQVDQTGGYTQMRPPDFRDLVHRIARRSGVSPERIILGGDHLGPNRWRTLAPEAMANAEELVAAYIAAGFTKIHLDCSMPCQGDPVALSDELVSERSTRLMRAAEDAADGQAFELCDRHGNPDAQRRDARDHGARA